MDYQTYTLPNGIRIIHKPEQSNVSYFGLLINAGTRDELFDEHGIAHFIEHAVFKGTKKRNAFQIINRVEDIGADLNAYTTKEETCYYAIFLNEHYERLVELIRDIVFNPVFPEKELEKEKQVIMEEINSYQDNPSELIFDEFENYIFKKHPMGRSILGDEKSIKSLDKQKITAYLNRHYQASKIVLCSIGNIPFGKLLKLFLKYFSELPVYHEINTRSKPGKYTIFDKKENKETYQTHCLIGSRAYSSLDERRNSLLLLNNILGGQGMNSRLNLALRERHGYSYSVESTYTSYSDTGVVNIYFAADRNNLDKCIHIINKELDKLRSVKLGSLQLSKAKKQLMGQIAISSENKENMLFTFAKSFQLYNKVDSIEDIHKKLESVSSSQLIDTANDIFDKSKLSSLIYEGE